MQFAWSTPPDFRTMLADTAPISEAGTGVAGSADKASRDDHRHPRLTATASGTLNASGEATITFTRLFANKPAVAVIFVEGADNQPVVFKIKSWLGTGGTAWTSGDYTGCVIKGYRSQTIPQNLATLLLGAIFNLFGGSASGVEYSFIALERST